MKRALWAVPVLALVYVWFARGAYSYYYTENGANPVWSNWILQDNGGPLQVYTYSSGGYSGIASSSPSGGLGRMTYPSSTGSPGEVKLTFRMDWTSVSNGSVYLSASSDLSAPGATPAGSGYKVDFGFNANGTQYALSKIVNGQLTLLASGILRAEP